MARATGRVKSVMSVGLGLLLGMLAGAVLGLVLGVGIAMLFGVI